MKFNPFSAQSIICAILLFMVEWDKSSPSDREGISLVPSLDDCTLEPVVLYEEHQELALKDKLFKIYTKNSFFRGRQTNLMLWHAQSSGKAKDWKVKESEAIAESIVLKYGRLDLADVAEDLMHQLKVSQKDRAHEANWLNGLASAGNVFGKDSILNLVVNDEDCKAIIIKKLKAESSDEEVEVVVEDELDEDDEEEVAEGKEDAPNKTVYAASEGGENKGPANLPEEKKKVVLEDMYEASEEVVEEKEVIVDEVVVDSTPVGDKLEPGDNSPPPTGRAD